MNIILFDGKTYQNLKPLTLTKPLGELRMGILTFKERWQHLLDGNFSYKTEEYLSHKYPLVIDEINLFINPSYFPNNDLLKQIKSLKKHQYILFNDELVAGKLTLDEFKSCQLDKTKAFQSNCELLKIENLWDLFTYNEQAITFDFDLLTKNKKSEPISATNGVQNPKNIFLEEGARVEYALLNANNGPIYVGKNAEIMEGSMVRGSLALCENAKLNMGTKIYSGTTIGPYCKVGGELNNSVLMGYSNKGHDGFLGNSVIGEWCNLGADTNNSNLKNNYSNIKIWQYESKDFKDTGLQFCGLIMGDFSKSAINTQFNTGTVVGVSANVFDVGFPPKYVPSFSWGGGSKAGKFELDKAYQAAQKMMERRNVQLTNIDKKILKNIYNITE